MITDALLNIVLALLSGLVTVLTALLASIEFGFGWLVTDAIGTMKAWNELLPIAETLLCMVMIIYLQIFIWGFKFKKAIINLIRGAGA